jgi:hypothetical protein
MGWSILEAFYLGLPILSREVGVVSFIQGQPGVHVYRDEGELFAHLGRLDFAPAKYDFNYLEQHAFTQVFERILSGQQKAEGPQAVPRDGGRSVIHPRNIDGDDA